MNQSGYNINDLAQEAKIRWLKPAEVLFILRNHENLQITDEPPQKPPSGSFFLFNRRVLRFFRKDGHSWRRKKDGRSGGEAHERLKVGNVEALSCYYAHGEQNPNFQRRSYWMLDPAHDHIVMVHYRDISEVRQNVPGNVLHSSPISPALCQNPNSYSTEHLGSCMVVGESYARHQNMSHSVSVEINSDVAIKSNGVNYSDTVERAEEVSSSSSLKRSQAQALRMLEKQLSIDKDNLQNIGIFDSTNEKSGDFDNDMWDLISDSEIQPSPNGLLFQHHSGDSIEHSQSLTHETIIWNEMLDGCEVKNLHGLDEHGLPLATSSEENVGEHEYYGLLDFLGNNAQNTSSIPQQVEGFKYSAYPPASTNGASPDVYSNFLHQVHTCSSLEDSFRLTVGQKQKFTIQDISPEWGYASEATKVIIVGSFLSDPSDSVWHCMFGDIEVPVQVVREGVMRCLAPPNLPPGKVTVCITAGNRESCSELREFEYRVKSTVSAHSNQPENDSRSSDELLLLVKFVQTLLSDSQMDKGEGAETGIDLFRKSRVDKDLWGQVIEAVSVGIWTSSITTDWLLQELLKDKLQQWLYHRPGKDISQLGSSLSKKEPGIIHMISGLGFEWALHPLLKSGIGVNFRDINGWSPLHWAARFGREKMVAALIAAGASAGAVTDCNSQDLVGKTPASIAATYGHLGLAGYLSEVALTSHLSSLTLEESERSKLSADVVADRTISSVSETSPTTNDDQVSLKDTLSAVRNAARAAARIQTAFRAHSFRKRQERGILAAASAAASATGDMYSDIANDIKGLSAASKSAFRKPRDYNSAAVSIQKKYRGWKARKDFLAFRRKVIKIQAHIRGYQVRKQYHVSWAVGILEKVVLRWRRRGVGLRGFKHEKEPVDEFEDEDILRLFRKKKVYAALDEALSRVLLMVECPEARKQYRRILEKYRQAKAELEGVDKEKEQSLNDGFSYMENDGNNLFT